MGIKPLFIKNDIRKRFDALLEEVEKAQIEALKKLGEECITHARNISIKDGGFQDQSGNLRSSIGYMVFKNGVAVHTGYEAVSIPPGTIKVRRTVKRKLKDGTTKTYSYMANVRVGGDGTEGVRAGQELANRVGSQTKGIVLVVTAGMNYATYVEAKGRDVLASAELLAERKLPKILSDFIEDIKKLSLK
jgi:hypothetical protein